MYDHFLNSLEEKNGRVIQDFSINREVVKTENNIAINERKVVNGIGTLAAKKLPGRDGMNTKWNIVIYTDFN